MTKKDMQELVIALVKAEGHYHRQSQRFADSPATAEKALAMAGYHHAKLKMTEAKNILQTELRLRANVKRN